MTPRDGNSKVFLFEALPKKNKLSTFKKTAPARDKALPQ
jgi:hypothetical protein